MKSYMIAIRDVVADCYTQPVTTASLGAAIRDFGDRCSGKTAQQNDTIAMHPEHFELWVIGSYDDSNAEISDTGKELRRQIAVGANYANQK